MAGIIITLLKKYNLSRELGIKFDGKEENPIFCTCKDPVCRGSKNKVSVFGSKATLGHLHKRQV